jgi:cell division septation protein DedD
MTPGIPSALGPAITDPDQPILLLVATEADAASGRAAIELAAGRAGQGQPTILADGGVTTPTLHELLGTENLEGLADLFLFGASLPHVTTRPEGQGFDFIPAGAYVPDPSRILDNPRWGRLAAEMETSGSLLMVYVPAGTGGLRSLSQRVPRAIVIGAERDAGRVAGRLDPACRVVGAMSPHGAAPEPARPEDRELTEPVVIRAEPRARRNWIRVALALILVLALGAAGWFVYRAIVAVPAHPAPADTEAPAEPAPVVRGEPVETPLPVSVAVEAHQDLTTAFERVAALRRAEPRIDFFLAPVAVGGGVYYRLLAGPVADRETGTALLQRLVDAGHKTAFDSWAVRPTEFAFALGEFDTADAAAERVQALAAQEIPAYVVRVRYEPGPTRHRVYGGAFESPAEAEVMASMLEEAGVRAELVPRTGEPTA